MTKYKKKRNKLRLCAVFELLSLGIHAYGVYKHRDIIFKKINETKISKKCISNYTKATVS